jgi:hypothetical protein
MIFGPKKEKRDFFPLTEDDIRSRLYGSAVGVSADTFDRPVKGKKDSEKASPLLVSSADDETARIHHELTSLRLELEQAKKRLKKIKGINTKRLQIVLIYVCIFFAVLSSLALILRNISSGRPQAFSSDAGVLASVTRYTVQVAVSERIDDAEKFKMNLENRGYKPFILKSSSASGKDRFIIYAGEFNDRKSASGLMNDLQSKEGIKDSFVVNMPK